MKAVRLFYYVYCFDAEVERRLLEMLLGQASHSLKLALLVLGHGEASTSSSESGDVVAQHEVPGGFQPSNSQDGLCAVGIFFSS